MATPDVQYLSSGDTALTVQFGTVIERELNSRIVAPLHSAGTETPFPDPVEEAPVVKEEIIKSTLSKHAK